MAITHFVNNQTKDGLLGPDDISWCDRCKANIQTTGPCRMGAPMGKRLEGCGAGRTEDEAAAELAERRAVSEATRLRIVEGKSWTDGRVQTIVVRGVHAGPINAARCIVFTKPPLSVRDAMMAMRPGSWMTL